MSFADLLAPVQILCLTSWEFGIIFQVRKLSHNLVRSKRWIVITVFRLQELLFPLHFLTNEHLNFFLFHLLILFLLKNISSHHLVCAEAYRQNYKTFLWFAKDGVLMARAFFNLVDMCSALTCLYWATYAWYVSMAHSGCDWLAVFGLELSLTAALRI